MMQLSLSDFDLPKDLIAKVPSYPREAGGLLDLRGVVPNDCKILDLIGLLSPNDLIIANNTKTLACRFKVLLDKGYGEITLIE
ncbi:MAG: S-adenosylmethionine:tRNA ribosyltransferase-isomerase, partial [Pseudomonadota bacterium]